MTNPAFVDAFNLLCGAKLGEGIHREVFECHIAPQYVVKVERDLDHRSFSNVHEWQFWLDNKDNPGVAKWLAPCYFMSPDGRILLQHRVRPAHSSDELPTQLPAFLNDLKPQNFGWLDGNFVCVDYAGHIDNPSKRLKKVNWRTGNTTFPS